MAKELVTQIVKTDGVITRLISQERVVHQSSKGRYITHLHNRYYLTENNHWTDCYKTIGDTHASSIHVL